MDFRADGIDEFLDRLVGHADYLVVSIFHLLVHLHQWECLAFNDSLFAENVDENVRNGLFLEFRCWNTEVVLSSRIESQINIDVVLFCNSELM